MLLKTCVDVVTTHSFRPALSCLYRMSVLPFQVPDHGAAGKMMFVVIRSWQLTLDLYPISCYGLDMQDRQLLELTSQMTVSTTWGSAAEVQFMLSVSFCWDRLFPGKEGRKKVHQRQADFRKKAVLVLDSRVVCRSVANISGKRLFFGNVKWIKKKGLKKTCLSLFIVSVWGKCAPKEN